MRSVLFPLFAVVALCVFSACPTKPACASNCAGCCDAMGQCQLGSVGSACGKGGITCKQCSVSETCDFGTCSSNFNGSGGGFSGSGGGFSGTGGGSSGGVGTGGGSGGGFGTGGGNAGGVATGGGAGGGNATGGGVGIPNETCATAIAMTPVSSTQFSAAGTLAGAGDDHAASCGGSGSDVAYSFVVTTTSDVSFTLSAIGNGGSGSPVGYLLRDDCVTELACHSGTSQSPSVRLNAGSYRLIVDATSPQATGAFTANVVLTPTAPLPGDTCSSAEAIAVGGTVNATTDGYLDDHVSPTCNTIGADRFYRFTLTASTTVTATVTPGSSSSSFGAYFIGPSTCTASEEFCRVSMTGGTATTATTTLPAGTHFLAVKNLSGGLGGFTLSLLTATSVPGDSCSTAVPLAFSGGSASATGTVVGAANDRSSSCTASSSADVVYAFTVTTPGTFNATVTPTGTWRPVLTLTSGTACSSATETSCGLASTAGGSASVTNVALTAGTYFLWVDSVSGAGAGAFSLSLTLSGASTGDSCSGPIPLTFSGGTATVSGSTSGLVNDNSSSCTTTSGPDSVYSFTATAGQIFSATLRPTGFQGHLVLRGPNLSCASAAQVACQLGSASGATTTLPNQTLTAGTYYLWVDGVSGGAGSYNLTANLGGAAPSGETCTTAIPLTFVGTTATASGTTVGATADRSGSCAGSGPDRVYSFTVTGTRTFTVTVTPGTTYQPVIYLTTPTTCTASTDVGCTYLSGVGNTTTMPTQTLSAGTYYLWLDSFSSNSGTYSFTATLQ